MTGSSELPRPLNAREREVLRFLLDADFPGASELRDQASEIEVLSSWAPCCPTIEFTPRGRTAVSTPFYHRIPVQALPRDESSPYELLLHIDQDGRLRELELVHHGDEPPPSEFPPPEFWGTPWWEADEPERS